MNGREMENHIKVISENIAELSKANNLLVERVEAIEYILSIKTSICRSLYGSSSENIYIYATESEKINSIDKQIKMLAEALGYEFKPESTKKEPAKFVKKTKKEKK